MKLRPTRSRSADRTRQRPIRPEPRMELPDPRTATTPARQPRRGRRPRVVLALLMVALVLVAALVFAGWRTLPELQVGTVARIANDPTPAFELRVERGFGLDVGDVDARIDGSRVARRDIEVAADRTIRITAPQLTDGPHQLRVRIERVGVLRRTLVATREFTIDTKAPRGRLREPAAAARPSGYVPARVAAVTTRSATLRLDVEPGSSISVTTNAGEQRLQTTAQELGPNGEAKLALPEGLQVLTLRVRDVAGNETVARRRVLVDTVGPKITGTVPRIVRNARLGVTLRAQDPHGVELRVLVDGTEVEAGIERTVVTPAPDGPADADAGEDIAAEDTAEDAPPIAATYALELDEALFEGRHQMEVIASDSLGATTRTRYAFVVDSTETLAGASGLRPSARGGDVLELQRALVQKDDANRTKLAAEMRSKVYGPHTTAAVRSYQRARGVDADGVAGSDTLAVLTLKIVVNRTTKQLTLFRMGAAVKTWGVAVGAPKYPTPAGSFAIQNMQKDPTWTPPDSDWAKDAEPIPPGPDNPLGTRWMAINGTVGIHGTNNPASIGYSVSHGCIRMRIPDVEELFEMVRVGTPVDVV